MTTIAFGGGPTLEQRRSFAAFKDGTQVPGYRGYIPHIKYTMGQTYGNETHDLLSEKFPKFRAPTTVCFPQPEVLKNELPESTGDNKYTKDMVPGYTGYIPTLPFKFGATYKNECDLSIDEHISAKKKKEFKTDDIRRQMLSYPRLTAISCDPLVRDRLNLYRDTHPTRPTFIEDKRSLLEPPMPGYLGFVPRVKTTEIGLGCRYHESARKGFATFARETDRHSQLQRSVTDDRFTSKTDIQRAKSAPMSFSRRIYVNDGMIPKYTGYVPRRRYAFGNTYGDTTRQLDVCAHDKDCYGAFTHLGQSVA
ncbi:protein FAM166B-like [Gigantopelta aegis]|uniref:protein FAM166B-like n=1 Tax=Gigantopelta aegis TaxID=1735272 RepID=UPI001B887FA6|nr:protein FAM166B-like [Gigantopelta aegis]